MKVKLNSDNMVTFFAVIVCCDTSHYITKDYTVGNRIFE